LKAAVRVQNRLGWEIARADAIYADAIQRTTSQLPSGSIVTAYALLRLPYGAPPDAYRITLIIYDERAQPSGYDLIPGDGGTAHKDMLIGTWITVPGADWSAVNQSTVLPFAVNIPVSPDLTLIAHDLQSDPLHNGDTLRFTLLWQGDSELPGLKLVDKANGWEINVPPPDYPQRDEVTLDWRSAQIPADAPSGTAEIDLPDGTVLGSYTIESIPLLGEPPAFDTAIGAPLPDIGKLIGYSVNGDMTDRTQPFTLTLIWQAEQPAPISYTVFAQLVTDDGRVLAQTDSLPSQGTRPTTGWRPGEYITDTHTVTFHADAIPGSARLIVGMYDTATGQRVQISPEADFITLRDGIEVQ
jgi:hypothetical protein